MPGPARAVRLGAAFGFFCYATYDLTNLATLRDWSVLVTLVDVALGQPDHRCGRLGRASQQRRWSSARR